MIEHPCERMLQTIIFVEIKMLENFDFFMILDIKKKSSFIE